MTRSSTSRIARKAEETIPKTTTPVAGAGEKIDAAEAAQAPAPSNENAPKPQLPGRKVVVFFKFWRKDGSTGEDRAYVNDVLADIRTQGQLEGVERMILQLHQEEYTRVFVTNWKPLEA